MNTDLDELFRSKLENSELIPGEAVRTNLMRKLARKEFLRFNPSRFNIYYMGGIVAAGVATALLLSSRPTPATDNDALPDTSAVIRQEVPLKVQISERAGKDITRTGTESVNEVVKDQTVLKVNRSNSIFPTEISGKADTAFHIRLKSDTLHRKIEVKEGIAAVDRKNTSLQRSPLASFDVSSSSGCIPLKVRFRNSSVLFDSCRWIFGDGGYSALKDPEWIFDTAGEYTVTLKAYGTGGVSTFSSVITAYPRPAARFEIDPEDPIIPDDEIRFMNYSVDAVKCRWDFGDGRISAAFEPVHKYSRYGNYDIMLTVWSENGCVDSLSVLNAFAGSGNYITFPNAFIPNADGPAGGNYSTKSDEAAQIFHPVTSGVSDYQLRIFSKAGILIFESNDINTGWDGYHKGQLCEPGVYIWKVRGTFKNGEPFVKMGDVTLLKR